MIDRFRAALPLLLFLLAFFVVWTLRATVFISIDESISSALGRAVYSNVLKFAVWVLPAVAFVWWVRRISPPHYLGISIWPDRLRWQQCLGITATFIGAVAVVELAGEKSISFATLAALPLALWVLQFALSPLLEEILFRGFVLRELLMLMSAPRAMALTSLLFVGTHLPYWLTHDGASTIMTNAAGVFIFSLVACWLFVKTESIWPPTLAHIANNLLTAVLIGKA
jgi:membrane protease YdiL (CAAX protease family)